MKPQTAAAFTEPQTTAASRQPPCVWPLDSTIEDYMGLARKYSEGVDQVLMELLFAVVSGLCSHATFTSISADGVPQPLLVSPTGMRKTTTLQLVTISPATCFRKRLSSMASRAARRSSSNTWLSRTSCG